MVPGPSTRSILPQGPAVGEPGLLRPLLRQSRVARVGDTGSEPLVTKGTRYRLLAVLYGSQFIPLAFLLYGLPAVLRAQGAALERIAILQLIALVWVVKFAWAPLVDRYGSRRLGHYRGWLLVLQALLTGVVLLLVPLDVVEELA